MAWEVNGDKIIFSVPNMPNGSGCWENNLLPHACRVGEINSRHILSQLVYAVTSPIAQRKNETTMR